MTPPDGTRGGDFFAFASFPFPLRVSGLGISHLHFRCPPCSIPSSGLGRFYSIYSGQDMSHYTFSNEQTKNLFLLCIWAHNGFCVSSRVRPQVLPRMRRAGPPLGREISPRPPVSTVANRGTKRRSAPTGRHQDTPTCVSKRRPGRRYSDATTPPRTPRDASKRSGAARGRLCRPRRNPSPHQARLRLQSPNQAIPMGKAEAEGEEEESTMSPRLAKVGADGGRGTITCPRTQCHQWAHRLWSPPQCKWGYL